MPFKPTQNGALLRKVATKYGCDIETVRGWQKEGAPLDQPRKLAEWLEGRKSGNDELEPTDLKGAKLDKIRAETARIKFRLNVDKGDFTANSEITRLAVAWAAQVRAEFMLLLSETPTWQGLDAPSLQDRARTFVNGALGRLTTFAAPTQQQTT